MRLRRLARMRSGERGFALLVVFLMASAVALYLYTQLPRVAFESAREREQLLIDRGNQYKRAIYVYWAVNKRYPARIEDLENTNNVRFLRRRYKNPFTGSDEWRLIHTNGSYLTDSLVEKPPAQNAQNGTLPGAGPLGANNLNTSPAANGNAGAPDANGQNPQPTPLNAAALARPSDRPFFPGGRGGPQGGFGGQPGGNAGNPGSTNTGFGTPGFNNAGFGTPGFNNAGFNNAGFNNAGFNNAGTAGYNPANYNPNDPSTWPPITLPPVNGQNGQTPSNGNPQGGIVNNLAGGPQNNGFQNGQNVQVTPGGAFAAPQPGNPNQPFNPQLNQPITDPQNFSGAIPGQAPGLGGQNPQPTNLNNGNPNPENAFNPANGQPGIPTGNQNFNQNFSQPSPGNNFPSLNANPALAAIAGQLANALPLQNNAPVSTGITNPNSVSPNGVGAPFQATPIQGFGQNTTSAVPAANGPTNGTNGGPGIAGVASLFEGPSIKSYRERLKYQEWEFVYQPSQGQAGQVTAQPANPLNPQNGTPQSGQPASPAGNSPFGGIGAANPNSSFGNLGNAPAGANPFAPAGPTQ